MLETALFPRVFNLTVLPFFKFRIPFYVGSGSKSGTGTVAFRFHQGISCVSYSSGSTTLKNEKPFFRRCWPGSRAPSAHGASRNRCLPTDRHTDTEKRQGGRDVEMRRETEILYGIVEELKGPFLRSFWEWFAYICGQRVLNLQCSDVPYRTFSSSFSGYLAFPVCFKTSACWKFFLLWASLCSQACITA